MAGEVYTEGTHTRQPWGDSEEGRVAEREGGEKSIIVNGAGSERALERLYA